jgi:hypothetical protein
MIDKTIIGLKKLGITWIFNPCLSYIITTSNKSVLTKCQSLTRKVYGGFLRTPFLHIYPQNLKKKGYDNAKDKVK